MYLCKCSFILLNLIIASSNFVSSIPIEPYIVEDVDPDYRLNDDVLPVNYKIELKPYILKDEVNSEKYHTFEGEVSIKVKTEKNNIKEITLHKHDILKILEKSLKTEVDKEEIEIKEMKTDKKTEKLTLILGGPLKKGTIYVLYFKYSGPLRTDMKGFYKSYYNDNNGQEIWLASTHFQTHHARSAFPCFDEPKFKATFDVSITRQKNLFSFSNTKIETTLKDIEDDDWAIDTFKTTPEMSTYLLAFTVSDFKRRTDTSDESTDWFGVIARPEAFQQTEFSFDVGPILLSALEEFTGIPYLEMGNDKLDLAAIPDFSAGAMENWGLITYRETALLFDKDHSTAASQQRIATVVAHEETHLWFGDLVTCEWWSWTWLNEGFARYFQYFITHEVFPSWELEKQFVVEQVHTALQTDSMKGTVPMSNLETASPAELSVMFGTISYNKGASVIRMIRHLMGDINFTNGLRKYLKEREYDTATPDHLFKHLTGEYKPTEVDFLHLLKDFTEQSGYPVVHVSLEGGKMLKLKQNRFILGPHEDLEDNLLWNVPITFTTDKEMNFMDTSARIFLEKTSKERLIELQNEVDFVLLNIQQVGYYRVNYDIELWHKIHHTLEKKRFGGIHVLNRAQICDDLLNFGRSGLVEYDHVLDILEYLRFETDYLPWKAALTGFSYLETRLGVENGKLLGKYLISTMENVFQYLEFNERISDKHLDKLNRDLILQWLCKYGKKECIDNAKSTYETLYQHDENTISPNIRYVVYCSVVREGNDREFDEVWQRYDAEKLASEKEILLKSLGCARKKDILEEFLEKILTTKVRLQDRGAAFTAAYSSNPENLDIVFNYITEKYEHFKEILGLSTYVSYLESLSSRFTNMEQYNKLKKFKDDKQSELGDYGSSIESALVQVERNIKWSEEKLPPVLKFLKSKTSGSFRATINIVLLFIASSFLLILR